MVIVLGAIISRAIIKGGGGGVIVQREIVQGELYCFNITSFSNFIHKIIITLTG